MYSTHLRTPTHRGVRVYAHPHARTGAHERTRRHARKRVTHASARDTRGLVNARIRIRAIAARLLAIVYTLQRFSRAARLHRV